MESKIRIANIIKYKISPIAFPWYVYTGDFFIGNHSNIYCKGP